MARPESDFDTDRQGTALLNYAEQYRRQCPEAKLSEIADSYEVVTKIMPDSTNGNNGKHNGSRSLG